MAITKETLETIRSMKKKLEENKETDGCYSVYDFFTNGEIEFASDSSGPHYHKNKKTGDYVTEGIVEENSYVGKRKIIWTERIASIEENSPAVTDGLPHILMPGECVCLLKDMNQDNNEQTTPCYIPASYVTIPPGSIGMIKPTTKTQIGYVIVVKKLI